jgi:hypothetical protein
METLHVIILILVVGALVYYYNKQTQIQPQAQIQPQIINVVPEPDIVYYEQPYVYG